MNRSIQTLKIGQASPGPGAQPSPYRGPVDYPRGYVPLRCCRRIGANAGQSTSYKVIPSPPPPSAPGTAPTIYSCGRGLIFLFLLLVAAVPGSWPER